MDRRVIIPASEQQRHCACECTAVQSSRVWSVIWFLTGVLCGVGIYHGSLLRSHRVTSLCSGEQVHPAPVPRGEELARTLRGTEANSDPCKAQHNEYLRPSALFFRTNKKHQASDQISSRPAGAFAKKSTHICTGESTKIH